MSRIPDELVEQVRDATDLVGLIGQSVELRKTGSDWRGPCPFHGGTNRNFAVIPRKNMFYCYVCHEAGDPFTWLMKRHGLDWPTAVREAARAAGIVIPEREERAAGPDPREPLFGAMAAAHDWYARRLLDAPDAEDARRYLAGRGYDLEAAGELRLGWAPRRDEFLPAMEKLGLAPEVLREAGLSVRREDGSVHPRFRNRLLFPIHDLRGRVVAFGGRLLGEGEPKYLNSPETPVFHKGRTLYHLHEAKQAMRREGAAIIVEGYFDVLGLVRAGIEHVVAPLGTALTPDQASLLRRYAGLVTLLYDSDKAGLRATFRAADELLRHGLEVRVATMPKGDDPDTLVRTGGADAVRAILADAMDPVERKLQMLEQAGHLADVSRRRDAVDRLLPTLRATGDAITRELYVARVAEALGISRDVLATEVTGRGTPPAGTRTQPGAAAAAAPRAEARPEGDHAEWRLLRILLYSPHWRGRAPAEVPGDWFEHPVHRALFELLLAGDVPDGPPAGVDGPVREAWLAMRRSEAELATQDLDEAFVQLTSALEARPHFRRWEALVEAQRGATSDDAARLAGEERTLRAELMRRFPAEWQRRHFQRSMSRGGLRGRPTTPRRSPDAP